MFAACSRIVVIFNKRTSATLLIFGFLFIVWYRHHERPLFRVFSLLLALISFGSFDANQYTNVHVRNRKPTNRNMKSEGIVADQINTPDPMNIELTFINRGNDMNNSDIVLFQKNVATDFDEIAVAWKVIKNCGRGWSHKFNYPMGFSVGAQDSYGNVSNLQQGEFGQRWNMVKNSSGDTLELAQTSASSVNQVELSNNLQMGAINAQIYKDGKLLLTKTGIAPSQKAVFAFEPTIWIGVVSQVTEGQLLDSAILKDINTEISLLGIKKADIIMTGGGVGPTATPFEFHLEPTA